MHILCIPYGTVLANTAVLYYVYVSFAVWIPGYIPKNFESFFGYTCLKTHLKPNCTVLF